MNTEVGYPAGLVVFQWFVIDVGITDEDVITKILYITYPFL